MALVSSGTFRPSVKFWTSVGKEAKRAWKCQDGSLTVWSKTHDFFLFSAILADTAAVGENRNTVRQAHCNLLHRFCPGTRPQPKLIIRDCECKLNLYRLLESPAGAELCYLPFHLLRSLLFRGHNIQKQSLMSTSTPVHLE